MRRTLIEIRNLSKTFGSETAVNDVTLDIYDQEFLVLLGPSGCGKTTLLRLLGGFENPTAGAIQMQGRDIVALPPNKRPLNMVFQSYAVFPHLNVRDNIAYGLRIDGVAKRECERRVNEALDLVQLAALANRYAHQLSGGQRQRVALARALIKRPRVLLLDEPLSALDAKLRETMQNELVKLQHTVGITFVVVTHDQDEALSMAERVAVMEHGCIRQLDTPRTLYEAPQNRFVADFVGRMNILAARPLALQSAPLARKQRYRVAGLGEVTVHDAPAKQAEVKAKAESASAVERAAQKSPPPAAAFIAIRPEKLSIAAKPTEDHIHSVSANIENVSYYGGETVLSVTTPPTIATTSDANEEPTGATLTISIPNSRRQAAAPTVGEQVVVWWRAEDMITLAD